MINNNNHYCTSFSLWCHLVSIICLVTNKNKLLIFKEQNFNKIKTHLDSKLISIPTSILSDWVFSSMIGKAHTVIQDSDHSCAERPVIVRALSFSFLHFCIRLYVLCFCDMYVPTMGSMFSWGHYIIYLNYPSIKKSFNKRFRPSSLSATYRMFVFTKWIKRTTVFPFCL